MGDGTTVSYCSWSESGGSVITASGLGGVLRTGGGSSLLGFSGCSSGTVIALTCKRLAIGLALGISVGVGVSYCSSS